jgi:chemotaxis protein methyltransferase CheR
MEENITPLAKALRAINSEQNVAALFQDDLTAWIESRLGLHFPLERQPEIARMLALCAEQFGFADAAGCAQWLLAGTPTDEQLSVLASYLTVGETYFFRESAVFDRLRNIILPALLRGHCGTEQRLRIWCAACASGEEAYSLAILLDQCLPQRAKWDVTILATDVNAAALQQARRGIYREWSFRRTVPGLKQRYFKRLENGEYEIAAYLKEAVQFELLNLAAPFYPSWLKETEGMDLIFCRNVLMYFTPKQARQTATRLYHCLQPQGWLLAGQAELSASIFGAFQPVSFGDVVAYQRQDAVADGVLVWQLKQAATNSVDETVVPLPAAESNETVATVVAQPGHSAIEDESSARHVAAAPPANTQELPATAQDTVRQQQRLAEAVGWCEQALAINQLDPVLHYQLAVLAIEQGVEENAVKSLRNALFLDPDFVMAYVSWGELAERAGRSDEAAKHFANAARLLQTRPPHESVKASTGLTVSGLLKTLQQKHTSGGTNPLA